MKSISCLPMLAIMFTIPFSGCGRIEADNTKAEMSKQYNALVQNDLMLDLDADRSVTVVADDWVTSWKNQVAGAAAVDFVYTEEGRTVNYSKGYKQTALGTGRPRLEKNTTEINGHQSVVFRSDELVNDNDAAFDGLITGKGYTWFTVLKPYKQEGPGGTYPHAFFGCLRNSVPSQQNEGGQFAGFWGSFYLDGTVWMSSRNGTGNFSRGGVNTPEITGGKPAINQWHIIAGRQAAGTGTVKLDLFLNDVSSPVASGDYRVATIEPSVMAIGTERNAINHQGGESFDGEIAKLLIYSRPLNTNEMKQVYDHLQGKYFEPAVAAEPSHRSISLK